MRGRLELAGAAVEEILTIFLVCLIIPPVVLLDEILRLHEKSKKPR